MEQQDPHVSRRGGLFRLTPRARVSVPLNSDYSLLGRGMGNKRGRVHKGPRDQFIVRPTSAVGERIRQEAASTGRTYTDVCAEKLAAAYGLPAHNEPAPQESLPMTG